MRLLEEQERDGKWGPRRASGDDDMVMAAKRKGYIRQQAPIGKQNINICGPLATLLFEPHVDIRRSRITFVKVNS